MPAFTKAEETANLLRELRRGDNVRFSQLALVEIDAAIICGERAGGYQPATVQDRLAPLSDTVFTVIDAEVDDDGEIGVEDFEGVYWFLPPAWFEYVGSSE